MRLCVGPILPARGSPLTVVAKLGLGVNLMGYTGDIDMVPGEAMMTRDVLPRIKGDIMSHWGYLKHNATSLTGFCIWHKGFAYKGKNTGAAPEGR